MRSLGRARLVLLVSGVVASALGVSVLPPSARADDEADRAREAEAEHRAWESLKEKRAEGDAPRRGRPAADVPHKIDTSYGRVDGDVSLSVGLGVTVAPRAPRLGGDLRLRYLDTIGVFGAYEEGQAFGLHAEPRRVIATGLEIRPLFVGRWLQGLEWGSPRLDLAVDSFGLELGAFFAQPEGGAFGARPGLQAGLGLELPIFPRATGPWIGLHGGARWSDAALGGAPLDGPSDRSLFLSITVAYHVFFGGHAVDVGDEAPR